VHIVALEEAMHDIAAAREAWWQAYSDSVSPGSRD